MGHCGYSAFNLRIIIDQRNINSSDNFNQNIIPNQLKTDGSQQLNQDLYLFVHVSSINSH